MQCRLIDLWLIPWRRMCHITLTWCCFWPEWPFLFCSGKWQSLVRLSHSHQKQQNLVYLPCNRVIKTISFRSAHIFHLCSSQHNFCSKTWRFLYISFMCTAWANGIQGNLFPLCSNTVFKPTLDESMKTLQRPVVWSSRNSSINSWMLFQYTRSPITE